MPELHVRFILVVFFLTRYPLLYNPSKPILQFTSPKHSKSIMKAIIEITLSKQSIIATTVLWNVVYSVSFFFLPSSNVEKICSTKNERWENSSTLEGSTKKIFVSKWPFSFLQRRMTWRETWTFREYFGVGFFTPGLIFLQLQLFHVIQKTRTAVRCWLS